MKIITRLSATTFNGTTSTPISFEILPPMKGNSIQSIWKMLDPLMEFKPPFINVTYHRSEHEFQKTKDGLFRKVYTRKRPGTVSICAAIMNKYGVDAVPHLTCGGFSVDETEDALIDLHYLGVDNVLVLRGDPPKGERAFTPEIGGHPHAKDLVKQVVAMNQGRYLEDHLADAAKTDFCVGVAGYPEKHIEAPNLDTDLRFLKEKVDAGAEFIVTQMFFDNAKYFRFVEKCRAIGITVPIIPGLKPLTNRKQLIGLPRTFSVRIPDELCKEVENAKTDEAVKELGIAWCTAQANELKKNGAPCLHFYTMGQSEVMVKVVRGVV